MLVLLLLFGISIALATFIENDFGTDSARKLVYRARWFELLLLLGAINIIGVSLRMKLFTRDRLPVLAFHLAFIVIIIGAGITRYFGNEGTMHIREGETTSEWLTTNTYVNVLVREGNAVESKSFPVLFAPVSANRFHRAVRLNGKKSEVELTSYLPRAIQGLAFDDAGEPVAHLVSTQGRGRENIFMRRGMHIRGSGMILGYMDPPDTLAESTVYIYDRDGILYFQAPFAVVRTNMGEGTRDTLPPAQEHAFLPVRLHEFRGNLLVVRQFLPKARVAAMPADDEEGQYLSALTLEVTHNTLKRELTVWGMKEQKGEMQFVNFDDLEVGVSYGAIVQRLPFALRLNDFILRRYPGSESPEWYESRVQLIDPKKMIDREERIYMNHILKHRGYRFYQASYDVDEHGTVLSLNQDGPGTFITYLGYFIMGLGMLLTLLSRKSRFGLLGRLTKKRISQISVLIFALLMPLPARAQEQPELPEIRAEHAREFGSVLVQDNAGRIKPVNTLSSEIVRKVSRKEVYRDQTPDQVILGMSVFPEKWQNEPLIKISHERIAQILGISGRYASFLDFFSASVEGGYILRTYVEEANRKKPAYRSKFDNELIRVDERLNICYLVYTGALYRFFPDPADSTHTWHSPMTAAQAFSGEDSTFTTLILDYYFGEVSKAVETGDWKLANDMVGAIITFQEKFGSNVTPPQSKIKIEKFYNSANIFERLTNLYLLAGLILLLIQFIHVFVPRLPLKWFVWPGGTIIAIGFLFHAFSLGLRWYIAGHAPWSNGYEALTFIAWGGLLAGFIFSRQSSVTISSTAVLAALILQTAHLSWMDPQITTLAPVLKSYWLVIHVAVITVSYGFFGLGALVAIFNLLLMFFQSSSNKEHVDGNIIQLSRIIEMTLIAGLFLLTIGTFLGGVWANESWGRYWAWDPKETWALVTIIVYAIVLHLRLVPGLKGRLLFNLLSMWGFWSVIMTYFGVNYYLSGLHSYAAGDPLPIPPVVYYSVGIMFVISLVAGLNQYRLSKEKS